MRFPHVTCLRFDSPTSRLLAQCRKRGLQRQPQSDAHYVDRGRGVLYVRSGRSMMAVKFELPEDIEHHLEKQWGNLPRHALESLAIEGYRARVLSRSQVRRMLGLETGAEVDEFMKRAGVPFDYTVDDFEYDGETSRDLREAQSKELQGR